MSVTTTSARSRWALAAAASAMMLPLAGCLDFGAARFRDTRVIGVEHFEGAPIEVRTQNASVGIEKADRPDVQITAEIAATTQERLDSVVIRAEREPDGALRIYPEWPDGERKGNESCAFTILTPGAYGALVRTSNGKVTLTGLDGDADVDTSNGRISVMGQGRAVMGRSSNGRVTVVEPGGPVDVRTSNGRIEIREAPASVSADTSNGRVSVSLTDGAPGPVRIDSSNGSVTLTVGPAFAGYLELDTSNGTIDVSGLRDAELISSGKRRLEVRLGESEQRSVVDTSNGHIRLVQRQLQ